MKSKLTTQFSLELSLQEAQLLQKDDENEGLLKVTCTHCRCGSMSKTVQDEVVIAGLFISDFSYSSAAADKIPTT